MGQGELAMIPVRSDDRSKVLKSGCSSLLSQGFKNIQGTETGPSKNHGYPVGDASYTTQYHIETMVKGNLDTHLIVFAELERLANKKAVIKDVVMS